MDENQLARYNKMLSMDVNEQFARQRVGDVSTFTGIRQDKPFIDKVGEFGVKIGSGVGEKIQEAPSRITTAINKATSGELDPVSASLQTLGAVASPISQFGRNILEATGIDKIIKSAVKSGNKIGSALDLKPFLPKSIQEGIKSGQTSLDEVTDYIGEEVEKRPELKKTLKSSGEILEVLGYAEGLGSARNSLIKGEKFLTEQAKKALQGVGEETAKKATSLRDVFKKGGELVEQGEDIISEKLLDKYTKGELLNRAIKPSSAGNKKLRKPEIELEELANTLSQYDNNIEDILSLDVALSKAKKDIWGQIEKRIADTDANLEINKFKQIVDDIKSDPVLSTTGKADIEKLSKLVDDMKTTYGKTMPMLDAERFKQIFNAELNNKFGRSDIGEVYTGGLKKMNKLVGTELDNAVSKIPGEFTELKKKWGNLASYSDDIAQRAIVARRQNPSSLVTGFSRIEGVSNILSGIMTAKPSLAAKGVGQAVLGKVHANLNNADKLIKEAFRRTSPPKTTSGSIDIAPVNQASKVDIPSKTSLPETTAKASIKKDLQKSITSDNINLDGKTTNQSRESVKSLKGEKLGGNTRKRTQGNSATNTKSGQKNINSIVEKIKENPEGFTINIDGKPVKKGVAYSPYKNRETIVKEISEESVYKFYSDNSDLLKDPKNNFGGWKNSKTGEWVLDVSRVEDDFHKAILLARKNNQDAIYEIGGRGEVFVNDYFDKSGNFILNKK